MVAWCAISKLGACTWVHTLLVLTFKCISAICINEAFILPAGIIRISSVTLFAATKSLMESSCANSVCSTLLEQARISAFSVVACFSQRTFIIRLTTSYKGEDSENARFGQERFLRSLQTTKGSPMKPLRHVQVALCLLTEHCALMPHARVVQGSKHSSLMHARWSGHSGSVLHSGWGAEIHYNY